MTSSIYFHADTYHSALDKLEALVRGFDPAAPDMVRTDLIQVLGEELGVWPMSIFERTVAAVITVSQAM